MKIRHRVAALIIRNNNLLLVRGKGYSELWTPGGKIEKGESEVQALKRELDEELGLELISATFFKRYFMKNPYVKRENEETLSFLVEANGNPRPDHEIDSIIWYSKSDFLNKKYLLLEDSEKGMIPDLLAKGLLK